MGLRGPKSRWDNMSGPSLVQPTATDRDPPDHLGDIEKTIWRRAVSEYSFTDLALSVLESGLEAHMRARLCRERIALDGMQATGPKGEDRVNPLLVVERDARGQWLSAIRTLGIKV
jgi:P27 family predicted phage terminase small subunit